MKSVTVRDKKELKKALKSDVDEIVIENHSLEKNLKSVALIRKAGPYAIAAIVAAIPFIPFTGGASVPATMVSFMGASGAAASTGVISLVAAIGGVVVIGIFTDWEEVEIAGVFKLKRKRK
ncbi:hypothetical protein BZG13_08765 [Salinivibrio sp. ML323]|uniref:hypothetical protein n=1 Tax=Salinivibrio sp. ML323 TaxID=1909474 RepID=UPI0009871AE5|nr:hypothetical protein [Salinivibrio sp. ML323]OOE57836.1 hypothetical protein BZG13_08765 [Salinivibrio sp. ML323]